MNILRRMPSTSASAFAMSRPILGAILPDVDVAVIGAGMAGLPLRKGYERVDCARPFRKRAPESVVVSLPNIKVSASLSITAAPGLMHAMTSSRLRIDSVFGKIWTPISPLFGQDWANARDGELAPDAAYGRLQLMIEKLDVRIWKRRSRKHIRIRAQLNDWRAKLLPTFNSGWDDDVSTKDAFNRIPVSNLYLVPVGFVIWNADLRRNRHLAAIDTG